MRSTKPTNSFPQSPTTGRRTTRSLVVDADPLVESVTRDDSDFDLRIDPADADMKDAFDSRLENLTITAIAGLTNSEMGWLTRSDALFIIQKVISVTSADDFYLDVMYIVMKDDATVQQIAWLARQSARNLVNYEPW